MKILALDSSGTTASAAILEDDILVAEYTIHHKKTHSQTLLPMLDEIIRMTDTGKDTIDYIAVAAGPGSFTGLRIGSATAKGLGLALGKPLVAVPTLEGMAYQMAMSDDLICPMMDARRNQVYTAVYEWKDTAMQTVVEQTAQDVSEMIEKLNAIGRRVILLGDGVKVYQDIIAEKLKVDYRVAPQHRIHQSAAAVAVCAAEYIRQGKTETAAEHRPEYLRLSQAERERNEKCHEN